MKTINRQLVIYSFVLIATFIWIGFVCSISFMEAWLKFRAPNVTLPIGLGIGRVIFAALNKVEWGLAGTIIVAAFLDGRTSKLIKSPFLILPILILVLQTLWLFPFLNERAENIIQGLDVPPSSIHFYYIFLESIKVIALFILGISVIYQLNNNAKKRCGIT